MTMNPLPPQAYTKEILQKAYSWLLTQSSSIKEMASSQDMLVSLYLKAQRNGDASLEAPSIQNFKQELKSLANMMGDLSSAGQVNGAVNTTSTSVGYTPNNMSAQTGRSHNMNPSHNNAYNGTAASGAGANGTSVDSYSLHIPDLNRLDQQTLSAIADVKNTLNLSSDAEALRALVSLGYKQFKKI